MTVAPPRSVRFIAEIAATALLVGGLCFVLGPMLADFSTYGFHDWDAHAAYDYITVLSLKHGEGPWWHPWFCGGVPAFGYSEGATNLVSPYLPVYLLADIRTALRIEVLGQGLLALAGTFLFAGTLCRSVALQSLLAALFVLNGRWALQAAVGHSWHLQYAFMPWAFYFFERSLDPGRRRMAIGAGVALALACYAGGLYPLPHTALLLVLYACLRAALERSFSPVVSLAIAGASGIGFAAPKLFAVADQMRALPRLVDSTEVIDLEQLLTMLVAPDQRYGVAPTRVPAYGWHEWGIYVGGGGLLVLLTAVLFARGVRGQAYKALGLLCLLLGLGAFHPASPWALLHRLPVFASQHVPSRFHYPMLLMLGAAFVVAAGGYLAPKIARYPWLDVALLVPVALFVWDMARFSRSPFEQAFWMVAPANIQRAEQFEHHSRPPVQYVRRDWAPPMLLAMFANVGVIECYGVPNFVPSAIPVDSKSYRGLAFVEGAGSASVTEWTPNHAVVDVKDARPGSLVVYDMNYDPSWRADGKPALESNGLVAARLGAGNARVEFRYFPRTLAWSLPLAVLTLLACLVRPGFGAALPAAWSRARRFFDRKRSPLP